MPYLLPEDLDPEEFKCLTIRIPNDPQWEVNFWGAALELAKWFNHDRDALHKGKIVADKWRGWIDEAMSCNTITNIRIDSNRLQVQFCNSDIWVTLGAVMQGGIRYVDGKVEYDFDGDGTFDVSFYSDITQNFLGQGDFPIADATDRICRASWVMAREMCDNLNDIIRSIALGSKLLAGAMGMLASWTVIAQPAEETIEYFSQELPLAIIDFFGAKVTDPDTIEKVAQMLYCSLLANYPDNLNNVIDDIPLGIYAPATFLTPSKIEWTNFGDIAQSIWDTGKGDYIAYMVIAYAKVSSNALSIFNFLPSPVRQTMTQALANAQYFDDRDCVGFDCQAWEYVFIGDELGSFWGLFDPSTGYAADWDATAKMWLCKGMPNGDQTLVRLSLQSDVFSNSEILDVEVVLDDTTIPNVGSFSKWYCDNQGWAFDEDKYEGYGPTGGVTVLEKNATRIRFDMAANLDVTEAGAYIRPIKSIVVRGYGENPFI